MQWSVYIVESGINEKYCVVHSARVHVNYSPHLQNSLNVVFKQTPANEAKICHFDQNLQLTASLRINFMTDSIFNYADSLRPSNYLDSCSYL